MLNLIIMKIFKLLFSKILISALALLVQVGVVILVVLFCESYFILFQIFSLVFGLAVFLYIISKKGNPELKLPWIFILLVLPFFGTAIYCMFGNAKMPLKQYKNIAEITFRCRQYTPVSSADGVKIEKELGKYAGIENYLRKNSYSKGHLNCRITYFPDGESFFTDLAEELDKAEKFIFLEYFIIDPGFMWSNILEVLKRKVQDGVEVRVMYDDIGTVGKLKANYFKKLKKFGINCRKFNPFRPVVSGIHNNRDHRKIAVIDGVKGYTGGINIGDEYINATSPLGHWKDTAVKIEGSAAGNLTVMFLQLFDSAGKNFSDYKKYLDVDFPTFEDGGYVHPFGDGPKPFYNECVGENNYLNIINSAEKYVYITTPYLIPDYNIISALRNAAFRGVDVKIITPSKPDKKIIFNMTRSNYKYLLEAGVKIYEYSPGFIHAKSMVSDGVVAFVGTINLDFRSLVHHYECGAVMYKTPCIADIKKDFDETLSLSRKITPENFKMNVFASLANAVLNLFSPML